MLFFLVNLIFSELPMLGIVGRVTHAIEHAILVRKQQQDVGQLGLLHYAQNTSKCIFF